MTNPFNRADKHGAPDMRRNVATVGGNSDATTSGIVHRRNIISV